LAESTHGRNPRELGLCSQNRFVYRWCAISLGAVRSSNLHSRGITQALILVLRLCAAVDGVLKLLPPLVLVTGISVVVMGWQIRRACRHQIDIVERVQRRSRLRARRCFDQIAIEEVLQDPK